MTIPLWYALCADLCAGLRALLACLERQEGVNAEREIALPEGHSARRAAVGDPERHVCESMTQHNIAHSNTHHNTVQHSTACDKVRQIQEHQQHAPFLERENRD